MGYCGGESTDPTYHNLGGHTETLELDFDPAILSFAEILSLFWKAHNPFSAPRSAQYKSALFWHDSKQRAQAEESVAQLQTQAGGRELSTQLLPYEAFHLAEDYHQKYVLRRHPDFAGPLLGTYPNLVDFTASTAAARLNGYLAGHGKREHLAQDLPRLGLSAEAQAWLAKEARQ